MLLALAALAPGAALLMFFYLKDRYEPEPKRLVLYVFMAGAAVFLPVVLVEEAFWRLEPRLLASLHPLYVALVVAAVPEETMKALAVRLTGYRWAEFDEPMDGVVYAVAASLGFATVENFFYVLEHGWATAAARAALAVPGHALFGVAMGYYLGRAKFARQGRELAVCWFLSLGLPVVLHAAYDVLILSANPWAMGLAVPFSISLWWWSLSRVRVLEAASPFRPRAFRFRGVWKKWHPHAVLRRVTGRA